MNPFRILLTASLIFLAGIAFSQITVKGELRLGDTTQVHRLNLKDGSRLTGRVIGFDQEQLTFLFKNKNTLVFQFSEIENIEIQSVAPQKEPDTTTVVTEVAEPLSPHPFMYAISTSNGKSFKGKLIKGNDSSIRLQNDDGSFKFLNWREIDTLRYIGTLPDWTDQEKHILTTFRGDRFTGYISGFEDATLHFILENGADLKFSTRDVRRIELTEKVADTALRNTGDYLEMQGHERLYFSPTAFMLKKGQGEFRTVILNNSVDYGLSDNFTIGGTFATVIAASLISGKAKFGGSLNDYLHVAGGVQLFGAFAIDSEVIGAALAYGSLTVGTPEKFLSVAVGRGISGESDGGTTGISFSGSFRIAEHFRLYGEYFNFLDPYGDNYGFAVLGGSWFNARHRVDFGLGAAPIFDETTLIPFPLVSYAYRF